MNDQSIHAALKPLADLIVDLYARQLALQALVRESGVDQKKLESAIQQVRTHLSQIPAISYLQSQIGTPRLEALAQVLPTVRWPRG